MFSIPISLPFGIFSKIHLEETSLGSEYNFTDAQAYGWTSCKIIPAINIKYIVFLYFVKIWSRKILLIDKLGNKTIKGSKTKALFPPPSKLKEIALRKKSTVVKYKNNSILYAFILPVRNLIKRYTV